MRPAEHPHSRLSPAHTLRAAAPRRRPSPGRGERHADRHLAVLVAPASHLHLAAHAGRVLRVQVGVQLGWAASRRAGAAAVWAAPAGCAQRHQRRAPGQSESPPSSLPSRQAGGPPPRLAPDTQGGARAWFCSRCCSAASWCAPRPSLARWISRRSIALSSHTVRWMKMGALACAERAGERRGGGGAGRGREGTARGEAPTGAQSAAAAARASGGRPVGRRSSMRPGRLCGCSRSAPSAPASTRPRGGSRSPRPPAGGRGEAAGRPGRGGVVATCHEAVLRTHQAPSGASLHGLAAHPLPVKACSRQGAGWQRPLLGAAPAR